MFLEFLVEEAYNYTKSDKRKVLSYKDLSAVVRDMEVFDFLNDVGA